MHVTVIGAGLAGSECAWQLAQRGIAVTLREMKPEKKTPAHETENFAELCCSNSLRSDQLENAVGLLKEELRRLGSLILACADETLLTQKLGVNGAKLRSYANGEEGEDVREYYNGRVHKSIGHSTTMPKDVTSRDECAAVIFALSEMVAARLRKSKSTAAGVSVSLRYNDLTFRSRQCLITPATDSAKRLSEEALEGLVMGALGRGERIPRGLYPFLSERTIAEILKRKI